jgi:hypothetical protein
MRFVMVGDGERDFDIARRPRGLLMDKKRGKCEAVKSTGTAMAMVKEMEMEMTVVMATGGNLCCELLKYFRIDVYRK